MQHSVLSSITRELHLAVQILIAFADSLQDAGPAVSPTSWAALATAATSNFLYPSTISHSWTSCCDCSEANAHIATS